MIICPSCKSENPDAGKKCLACNINIQWAILHASKWEARERNGQQANSSGTASESKGTARKKRLFQNGSNITLSQNEEIKITRKTISFGRDVYQFHNVVGFSDGEVELGRIIPMPVILIGFLVGFVVANFPLFREYGITILVLSSIGLAVNLYQEKRYGLIDSNFWR
jgi:uncharacterized membrane protein